MPPPLENLAAECQYHKQKVYSTDYTIYKRLCTGISCYYFCRTANTPRRLESHRYIRLVGSYTFIEVGELRGAGSVNDHIYERVVEIARYVAATKATVRAAADHFDVSKSTVHKDITDRLRAINAGLYEEVAEVLKFNKATRHLRGGDATRRKYERANA
ncbi:MAG: Stage III sporulation protein D [Firmicutes bacterium]|nr:Stage III sporulation protein D [candidate division NPL-UPA2 bacterium]